jgi:hypothetical protein
MQNIPGWFPQTNKDTLEMLIKKHDVQSVIEIGTFVGLSAVWFAERVQKVITIDPFDALTRINYLHGEWAEAAKNQWENYLKNTVGFNNIEVIKMTSQDAAAGPLKDVTADLIYIDGSHEYEEVKQDILTYWPKAKKVLCGDDYTPSWPGVRRAVDELELKMPVDKNQRCWFVIP